MPFAIEVGRGTHPATTGASQETAGSTVTATGILVAYVGLRANATGRAVTQIRWNTSGTATFFFTHRTSTQNETGSVTRDAEFWTLDCTATRIADVIADFTATVHSSVLSVSLYTSLVDVGAIGTATTGASASPNSSIVTTNTDSIVLFGQSRTATGGMTSTQLTERVDGQTGVSPANDINYFYGDVTATAIGAVAIGASATTATGQWVAISFELLSATIAPSAVIPQIEYNDRRRRV